VIIFTPSRSEAARVGTELKSLPESLVRLERRQVEPLQVVLYHAGLENPAATEQLFASTTGIVVVFVATIAFKMGVLFAHVRAVLHFVRVAHALLLTLTCFYPCAIASRKTGPDRPCVGDDHGKCDGVWFRDQIVCFVLSNMLFVFTVYLSSGPCSLLPLVSFSFDEQGGACSVSEYAQQFGRAGRDGSHAVCVCFFNPSDSCGVRHRINEKMMTESESSTLFTKIIDRTTVTGTTSFMHVADFRAACVEPKKFSHVLAALQRLGVSRAGRAVPCRDSVRPGKNTFDGNEDLSENALSLWRGNILPQFRQRAAHRVPMARFYARSVGGFVSFLFRRAAGPAAEHEAVEEMHHEGLLVVHTSETFSNGTPLNIVADIEQDGWPKDLVDMLKADSQADLESLLGTHSFL